MSFPRYPRPRRMRTEVFELAERTRRDHFFCTGLRSPIVCFLLNSEMIFRAEEMREQDDEAVEK